ncbi:MAG: MinD/ParA family protein [Thermoleophilia bacterium]
MSRDTEFSQIEDASEAPVPLGRGRLVDEGSRQTWPMPAVQSRRPPRSRPSASCVGAPSARPGGAASSLAPRSAPCPWPDSRRGARARAVRAGEDADRGRTDGRLRLAGRGGVGKTTTCLLAGHTFASCRGDRVVALDASPDAGTLADRLRRDTHETVGTLLRDGLRVERYADVRAYTSQAPSRLEAIAGDDGPAVTQALGEAQITALIGLLERHYTLLLLDTQAGLLTPAARAALDCADQLVVVSPAALDGAHAAGSTLDWLAVNGHAVLAEQAVAVVNGIPHRHDDIDVDRIEEHFRARCRSCVRLPFDPHLGTGTEVDPARLRPATRRACLELAAAIATGFTTPRRHR